jgi:alkyl hydroperoxide reductase subunit AhpF
MSDPVRTKTTEMLAKAPNPVRLVVFTQDNDCRFRKETRELAQEVAGRSDKLSVEVYDLLKDSAKAAEHWVDEVPAICITGGIPGTVGLLRNPTLEPT